MAEALADYWGEGTLDTYRPLESEHEGSLRGREPERVLQHVLEEYDVIRRNWPVLEAILSSPEVQR